MPLFKKTALAIVSGLLLSSAVSAEPTNFRVGAGLFRADFGNAPAYLSDGSDNGFSLFAEFPQSPYAGSRFIYYRLNADDERKIAGGETQLMWGWNLDAPGFRAYTGPAWHYENIRVQRPSGSRFKTFNGWGWHAGIGLQYQAITVDLAATLRDPQDYNDENALSGAKDGDVWTYNLMTSYRF